LTVKGSESKPAKTENNKIERIHAALVLGIKDYFQKQMEGYLRLEIMAYFMQKAIGSFFLILMIFYILTAFRKSLII
jgi:hypothetical protein